MTEKDILFLIEGDRRMMNILHTAEKLNLPNWLIGAGFIRNKVWDYLHERTETKINDIDLVYFDNNRKEELEDKKLEEKLKTETTFDWEIVNIIHWRSSDGISRQYKNPEDLIASWPETATAVGIRLENKKLELVAPYGIEDLVNLIVRPSPKFKEGIKRVKERMETKKWLEKWPKLKFLKN